MNGLVARDLVAGSRILLGFLAVTVAAGCIAGAAAALLGGLGTTRFTGDAQSETALLAEQGLDVGATLLITFVVTSVVFALVPTIVVLSSTARLAVRLRRRVYARWMLVGIPPSRVRGVVLAQLCIVAAVGGAIGSVIAAVGTRPALTPVLAMLDIRVNGSATSLLVDPRPTLLGAVLAMLGVVVTVLVSAPRAVLDASGASPVEALRDADAPVRTRLVGRIVVMSLAAPAAALCALGVATGDPTTSTTNALFLPVLLAVVVAAAGSWLSVRVLRGWTALVPARLSSAWYLARHGAAAQLERSSTAVGPIMLGMALTGGAYGVLATVRGSMPGGAESESMFGFVAMLAGGPLLMAIVGAAASVAMSGGDREHRIGLLRASGATPGVIVRGAVLEAVAHTGTAVLLAVAVDLGALALLGIALDFAPIVYPPGPILVVAGACALLMVAATLAPTLAALSRPTTRSLVVE